MKSAELIAIEERAHAYNETLTADDKRFRSAVHVFHEDGSVLFWRYAFALNIEDEWLAIFTEHHGVTVYAKDDLSYWYQYGTAVIGKLA